MDAHLTRRAAGGLLAGFAAAAATGFARAQQPRVRVRGSIEKVDGGVLQVKSREGADYKVRLTDNARVNVVVKATLADIKPNSYIGVSAMPLPDGSQRALAIHIFSEALRGVAEGHQPWDLQPGSTMTNATVETTVASVDGQVIMVKYKDGEKKVIVPPEIPIVAYVAGTRDDLKAGAYIFIAGAERQADGTLLAASIGVGRDGVRPPM
ncbi:MAG: hypothetical protein IT538_13285 [Variibacter sp.]|nr:hypothetical protein [Variibacter sp.]